MSFAFSSSSRIIDDNDNNCDNSAVEDTDPQQVSQCDMFEYFTHIEYKSTYIKKPRRWLATPQLSHTCLWRCGMNARMEELARAVAKSGKGRGGIAVVP